MNFQIIINIVILSSIYLLVANSFAIIYYSTKFFHIAHAIIFTSGAYFSFFFLQQIKANIWLSIALSVILSMLLGVLIERLIYYQLRKRNSSSLQLLIASLGIYIIFQNVISLIWSDDAKAIRTGEVKVGHEVWGGYITEIQILTITISILLFFLTTFFFSRTNKGRQMLAVSSNELLANIFGINSNLVIVWTFAIGSAFASIAGILVAFDKGMTPTMGFNLLFYGVVAMIIGGVNSTKGLIGGSILLATAQNLGAYYFDSKWMDSIAYLILILFLIWKPLGFSGKQLKKVDL